MNYAFLMGRLTADPQLRQWGSGEKEVSCRFTLAVYNTPDKTDFIECTAFGMAAHVVADNCNKGQMLGVMASIHNNNYTDNNGVKHYGYNITVNRVYLCGKGV